MTNQLHPPHKYSENTGFTLIELLVVILIISILASLLTPAIRSSLNASQQLQCLNNTRQIGQGMHFYANREYGYLPMRDLLMGSDATRFWYTIMYREISGLDWVGDPSKDGTALFLRCPKLNLPVSLGWNFRTISYGKNDFLGATPSGPLGPVNVAQIKRPSKVLMVADSDDDGYYGMTLMPYVYAPGNRHEYKFSAVMVDGHSSSFESEKYLAPGVTYGYMDENGTMIVRTSSTTAGSGLHSDFLKKSWGYRATGMDYLTK